MLFGKVLEDIQLEDLNALIDNHVSEGKTIDYKSQLPSPDYESKKEFLSDVSSLANASGGYLFYGIEETNGEPINICGVGEIDPDSELQRLENSLRDNIEPRIPGFKIHPLVIDSTNYVIIIKIPRSWARPHAVNFQRHWRFYSRNSAGKYQLDVSEVRAAFAFSDTFAERIRNFRIERIGSILANELPIPLINHAKVVLHLIPANAFELSPNLNVFLDQYTRNRFIPLNQYITDFRYNIDGFVTSAKRSPGEYISYLQFFRNGIFEAVDITLLENTENTNNVIESLSFETAIMRSCSRYVNILNDLYENDGPYFVLLSLIGIQNYYIKQGFNPPSKWLENSHPVDRDMINVPEIVIGDLGSKIDIVFKPLFDIVWNAAGEFGSLNYSPDGRWKRLARGDFDSFTFNDIK